MDEVTERSKELGRELLKEVRDIIDDCSNLPTPERAARVVAFAILVVLDGSGEHVGRQYKIFTEDGEPVQFNHGDL